MVPRYENANRNMHQKMNDGSILTLPPASVYFGTTLPSGVIVVAVRRGSALVGSVTVYSGLLPVMRLMLSFSRETAEFTGPAYTRAAAGLPSGPTPFREAMPWAPSAIEPSVMMTDNSVTTMRSSFQR